MVRIGGQPLGFGKTCLSTTKWVVPKQNAAFFPPTEIFVFVLIPQQISRLQVSVQLISRFFFVDECGIVAQISQPLAESDISAYYISTFSFDHALVSLHASVTLEVNKNKSHTSEDL